MKVIMSAVLVDVREVNGVEWLRAYDMEGGEVTMKLPGRLDGVNRGDIVNIDALIVPKRGKYGSYLEVMEMHVVKKGG